jgi:hypothetical protein
VIDRLVDLTSRFSSRSRITADSGDVASLRTTCEPTILTGKPPSLSISIRRSYTSAANVRVFTTGLASKYVVMPHVGAGNSVRFIASSTASMLNIPRAIAIGSHASGSQHVPIGKPSAPRGHVPDGGFGSGVVASMPAATNAAVLAQPS